jgi:hypothetical protein
MSFSHNTHHYLSGWYWRLGKQDQLLYLLVIAIAKLNNIFHKETSIPNLVSTLDWIIAQDNHLTDWNTLIQLLVPVLCGQESRKFWATYNIWWHCYRISTTIERNAWFAYIEGLWLFLERQTVVSGMVATVRYKMVISPTKYDWKVLWDKKQRQSNDMSYRQNCSFR